MQDTKHDLSGNCCTPKSSRLGGMRFGFFSWAWILIISCLTLSYFYGFLKPFRESFWMYTAGMAPMLLLGFLLGGVMNRFIPQEYVAILLSNPRKKTVFLAVWLGFLMSACSHGMLAIAIELHKKGASTPVVVSFLLASPWANLPITLVLFSLFGLKALFIVFGALFVALSTGIVFLELEKKGWVEKNLNTIQIQKDFSIREDFKKRFKAWSFSWIGFGQDLKKILLASATLARPVLHWAVIGIALSSIFSAFVPASLFEAYLGPSLPGLLATLLLATVMEVCSEGTAPMAFEVYRKTGAFGNAFVFLMAGVVTDYTEIGLLWSNVGRRVALWLPAVAVPQVLILGVIANGIFGS